MRAGSKSWWAAKIRQLRAHMRAGIRPGERDALVAWVTPAQLTLFDSMHVADRRHGLDVVATLRSDGVGDPDVLVAGLLHDAAKGRTGALPRVVHSLAQAWGGWVISLAGPLPGMHPALERLRTHAEESAKLAAAAGCTARTVDLIRWQESPRDPDFGERLRLADEAN